jgi:hypothetical protein
LNLNVPGIIAAQRHVIAFDEKLDRIAQRRDALDQYCLATHKTHLHETPPRAPTPADPEDPGPLPRQEIAQALAGVANATQSVSMPPSFTVPTKHRMSLADLLQMILIYNPILSWGLLERKVTSVTSLA